MSSRRRQLSFIPVLAITLMTAAAPDPTSPAQSPEVVVRWQAGTGSAPSIVEVDGLDSTDLAAAAALSEASPPPFAWSKVFTVVVIPERGGQSNDLPPILGTYRVAGSRLQFEPRFPIEPGLKHQARFRPSQLPIESYRGLKDVVLEFTRPVPPPPPPTSVVRVDPTSDRLPENLLKFYLHFSAPMSRGEAYEHVALLDDAGKKLDVPFLELGEELWNPTGTRLTLLLDPGRIKRGLKPREDLGPILEAGREYTLVVDRGWPDATGHGLNATYRKTFRTTPTDEIQPDPGNWKLSVPTGGSSDPLILEFPEPLDRAMLDHVLTVQDREGHEVKGRIEVNPRATRWSFRPESPWLEGQFRVSVDATLEDLVGNSIARPFELDILRPIPTRVEAATVSIPFEIQAKRPT